jgi:uncharacterized membrane protein
MGGKHGMHVAQETRRMRFIAWTVIGPLSALTVAALVLMWPTGWSSDAAPSSVEELSARVIAIHQEPCAEELSDDVNGCGTATVRLEKKQRGSQDIEVQLPNGPGAPRIARGDDVVLIASEGPDGEVYSVVDHRRGSEMAILLIAFVLALVAFGRWRGLTAVAGLVVTFGVLLYFVVPAILAGDSPVLVAIVGAAAITLAVLYLTHGVTLSTTVAVIGTLASLALTGALSAFAVAAMHLTGITDDIATSVAMTHHVDMEGLLVASIVIGSLGVLDDVTVTQAATVAELDRANPALGVAQLYRAASRVGRSHIASVVNTIVLAYAGSSLPLLILILADNQSLGGLASTQLIAQEIVRSAVATLGLIAAVPLTTGLAALAVRYATVPQPSSTGEPED